MAETKEKIIQLPLEDSNKETKVPKWKLHTVGASSNEGAGAGIVLVGPEGEEFSYALRFDFPATNNETEYEALLAEMRIAKKLNVNRLKVYVDSKLVANQVNGVYEAKDEKMEQYLEKIKKGMWVEVLVRSPLEEREMNAVVSEEDPNWMTPIRSFIASGELPSDGEEAKKIRMKSPMYPSLRTCFEEIKTCRVCQVHAPIPKGPKNEMISMTSPWPFYKWGMDIVGPFPKAPGGFKFLIVTIDYFTKWVEAKALVSISGKQVKKFVWDNIVYRFGLPGALVTDNGKQLVENPFKSWCQEMQIKQLALTMPKTSNGETPFSLTYGTEAVIPVEIGMPTYRTSACLTETNEEDLRMNLNLLEERRELAAIKEAKCKRQIEKYYNQRVKKSTFKEGDLAYRKTWCTERMKPARQQTKASSVQIGKDHSCR
uniref:uncharacterized protein LOC122587823 n=1 Tax=Erigeron canadensis TaxID=72917 RepID=UPI001CB8BBD9|nr:uncharacterized protein LOC122587823 [Erigeron canadensis]